MNKESINFDEKYKDLLQQLAGKEKDFAVREAFIKCHVVNYNDFMVEAMAAASSYYHDALIKSQSSEQYCDPHVLDRCSKFDAISFMEAYRDTVKIYKGKDSFMGSLKNIFDKKQRTHLGAEGFEKQYGGGSIPGSDKKKNALGKLVRKIKEYMNQEEGIKGVELGNKEILEKLKELAPSTLSAKDLQIAFQLVQSLENCAIISLDQNVGEEDSSETLGDMLSSEDDPYESLIPMCSETMRMLQAYWEYAQASLKLSQKIVLKGKYSTLLTRNIMKPLKIYEDESGKQVFFAEFPFGDQEMYELYHPFSDFLMQLFFEKYLARAYGELPENLYTVYCEKLRDDFDFSDKIAASVLGIEAPAFSKLKKSFKTEFLAGLKKFDAWSLE